MAAPFNNAATEGGSSPRLAELFHKARPAFEEGKTSMQAKMSHGQKNGQHSLYFSRA